MDYLNVDNHVWRNTQDAPTQWHSPVNGELRIIDDTRAEFTTDGSTVPLAGGDLRTDPPKAFTADCPATLSR